MKKLILALALTLPMIASAQKFGHVNTQELFLCTDAGDGYCQTEDGYRAITV